MVLYTLESITFVESQTERKDFVWSQIVGIRPLMIRFVAVMQEVTDFTG